MSMVSAGASPRICIVACEASGDLLGARLVQALRQVLPDAQFAGVAGDQMRAAGVKAWADTADLSVMGITEVLKHLPRLRQNLFFSATMPSEIEKLAGELLRPNPTKVSVTPQATTVERIKQQVIFVETARKRALLCEMFAERDFKRVIVFTRTKRGADRVAKSLEAAGVEAAAIHGDKSQGQRERALAAFKAGEVRALVATDIAARGIDIDAVSHVIQYELPNVPEAYVHRIGRTARAGADGSAVAFCADDERNLLKDIQKVTRQTIPSFDRRNDRGLHVMTQAMPEVAAERAEAGRKNAARGGGGGKPQGRSDLPPGLRKQRNRPAKAAGRQGGGEQRQGQPQRHTDHRAGGQRAHGDRASTTAMDQSLFKGPKRGAKPAAEKRWSPID